MTRRDNGDARSWASIAALRSSLPARKDSSFEAPPLTFTGSGLSRNLDRIAARVCDEAIAEAVATPEFQAAKRDMIDDLKRQIHSRAVVHASDCEVHKQELGPAAEQRKCNCLAGMLVEETRRREPPVFTKETA